MRRCMTAGRTQGYEVPFLVDPGLMTVCAAVEDVVNVDIRATTPPAFSPIALADGLLHLCRDIGNLAIDPVLDLSVAGGFTHSDDAEITADEA